jgi:predicted DNA-binding transcriptional regulator AlpA
MKNKTTPLLLEITDEDIIGRAQKVKGKKWREWLTEEVTKATRAAVGLTSDMTQRQAAMALLCSIRTISRRIEDGSFPGAYKLNRRAVRIPFADVQRLKDSRRLRVA